MVRSARGVASPHKHIVQLTINPHVFRQPTGAASSTNIGQESALVNKSLRVSGFCKPKNPNAVR